MVDRPSVNMRIDLHAARFKIRDFVRSIETEPQGNTALNYCFTLSRETLSTIEQALLADGVLIEGESPMRKSVRYSALLLVRSHYTQSPPSG
jgi:hypothetical protein